LISIAVSAVSINLTAISISLAVSERNMPERQ
jgi:hypothetical protein